MDRQFKLENRMEKFYESTSRSKLMNTNVIVRLTAALPEDFRRSMRKPFDDIVLGSMETTLLYLCTTTPECIMGYCFGDEISLCLYNDDISSEWLDYGKVCCAAVSKATFKFNHAFRIRTSRFGRDEDAEYKKNLIGIMDAGVFFDAHAFNLPKEELVDYFYWRQREGVCRNVKDVLQRYVRSEDLDGRSCEAMKLMLANVAHVRWEELPLQHQRGICCVKSVVGTGDTVTAWRLDTEIPVFSGKGRAYFGEVLKAMNEVPVQV